MYAVTLANGQSLTVGGFNSRTYNGPATVVLNQQQYHMLPSSGYTDISVMGTDVMDIAITQASTGTLVVGRFTYLGYTANTTAASTFTLQDTQGAYSGATGQYSATTVEDVDLAANASGEQFYYDVPNAYASSAGIVINGGLAIINVTGTFSGSIRIGAR